MSFHQTSRATAARIALAVPAALLAVSLVACSGGGGGGGRPTTEEVTTGFQQIIEDAGTPDAFTDEQATCIAEALVASDITDEDLRSIADGKDVQATAEGAELVRTVIADTRDTCLAG